MKGMAFDAIDKETISLLINSKEFFRYINVGSNFDIDAINFILSNLAEISCRDCECEQMATTEMEYLVNKLDSDDWEFQCPICMSTALLQRMIVEKTLPKRSLINILNYLGKEQTIVAMITQDLENFQEDDVNLTFKLRQNK